MRLCRRQYFCGRSCFVYLLASRKYIKSFFSADTLKWTKYRRVISLIPTDFVKSFQQSMIHVYAFCLSVSSAATDASQLWCLDSPHAPSVACCPFGEPLPTTPCMWSLRSREKVQMVSCCPQIPLFLAHVTSCFSLCDREDLAKSLLLASALLDLEDALC